MTEGQYQIRLYQSLRDFWQENCTSYKDARSGISTYLLPLLYALLGAALCDLRCRFGTSDGNTRQLTSLGGARYATAIIAGAIVGVFTSLFPTSLSLPPLLIAFLLGYSVDLYQLARYANSQPKRGPRQDLMVGEIQPTQWFRRNVPPCRHCNTLLNARSFPPHLVRRLVLPQPDVDRVAKQSVAGPGQKRDLGDKPRLDPVNARKNKRRAEAGRPGRRTFRAGASCGPAVQGAGADRQAPCRAFLCPHGRRR